MKIARIVVTCLALSAASSLFADRRTTLQLSMGAGFPLTDIDVTNAGGGKEKAGTTGFVLGGQYLYDLRKDIGIGLDISGVGFGDKTSSTFIPGGDSTLSSRSTTVLAIYKWSPLAEGKVSPYVLAGAGFGSANLKVETKPSAGFVWGDTGTTETRTMLDKTKTMFSGALALGLDIPVTDRCVLGGEIRYTGLGSATYETTPAAVNGFGIRSLEGGQSYLGTTIHVAYKF